MIFYGRNVINEILNSEFKPSQIFIDKSAKGSKIDLIVDLSNQQNINIEILDRNRLNKLANSSESQGVAAKLDFKYSNLKQSIRKSSSFIYISEATFEHNIGAIIRSAEVAGINGVIIPKKSEVTPVVAKISAGSVFHIPIFRESIFNTIKSVKKDGFFVFGIERDGNKYFKSDLTSKSLFIIGGEDKSLSEPVRSKCDEILEIPQSGKVNSLNMSVASSIVLFERNRQLYNLNLE